MLEQFLHNPFVFLVASLFLAATAWVGFLNGQLLMLLWKPELLEILDFAESRFRVSFYTPIYIVIRPFIGNGQIFSAADLGTTCLLVALVLGLVAGSATTRAGWNNTTFKSQAPALFLIGVVSALIVYWMPMMRYQLFWFVYIIAVASQLALGFLYFRQINGKKDICLIEIPEDCNTKEIQKAYALLSQFGTPLSKPPRIAPAEFSLKFTRYQQATLKPGLFPLQVLVKSDGLYLRLTKDLNPEMGLIAEDGKLVHKAIWFFIDWENVSHLNTDLIIGHTETKLDLKDSGVQLILEGKCWELKRREALQTQPGSRNYAV